MEMKYVLCLLAIIAELFCYSLLISIAGIRSMGLITGTIPLIMYWYTCKAILRHYKKKENPDLGDLVQDEQKERQAQLASDNLHSDKPSTV